MEAIYARKNSPNAISDQANYLKLYGASLDKLISSGYLLASDREEMLKVAALRYANP